MDCRTAWFWVSTPPRYSVHESALYFKSTFFPLFFFPYKITKKPFQKTPLPRFPKRVLRRLWTQQHTKKKLTVEIAQLWQHNRGNYTTPTIYQKKKRGTTVNMSSKGSSQNTLLLRRSAIFLFFIFIFKIQYILHFSIFYFYFISLSCVFAEVFYLIHIQDVLVFVWIGSNYCTEYFTYTRQPSRPRLFRLLFLLVIRHYIQ